MYIDVCHGHMAACHDGSRKINRHKQSCAVTIIYLITGRKYSSNRVTEPNQSYNDYSLPRPLESNCPTLLGFRTEQPFRLLEQGTCSPFHPHPVQPTVQVGSNARLPDRQGGSCEREWGSSKIQYASRHLERQRKQRMYPGYRRYLRSEVE